MLVRVLGFFEWWKATPECSAVMLVNLYRLAVVHDSAILFGIVSVLFAVHVHLGELFSSQWSSRSRMDMYSWPGTATLRTSAGSSKAFLRAWWKIPLSTKFGWLELRTSKKIEMNRMVCNFGHTWYIMIWYACNWFTFLFTMLIYNGLIAVSHTLPKSIGHVSVAQIESWAPHQISSHLRWNTCCKLQAVHTMGSWNFNTLGEYKQLSVLDVLLLEVSLPFFGFYTTENWRNSCSPGARDPRCQLPRWLPPPRPGVSQSLRGRPILVGTKTWGLPKLLAEVYHSLIIFFSVGSFFFLKLSEMSVKINLRIARCLVIKEVSTTNLGGSQNLSFSVHSFFLGPPQSQVTNGFKPQGQAYLVPGFNTKLSLSSAYWKPSSVERIPTCREGAPSLRLVDVGIIDVGKNSHIYMSYTYHIHIIYISDTYHYISSIQDTWSHAQKGLQDQMWCEGWKTDGQAMQHVQRNESMKNIK